MATAPGWAGNNLTGPYWVYPISGTIQRQSNPILYAALSVAGWVGFATEADAKAFAAGNTVSKGKAAVSDVSNTLGSLTDIPKYIAASAEWIGNRGNWMRILKVIIGGSLILMGLHQLTAVKNATNVAVDLGKKVAETAAIT
jgi:hypothetical protein